MVEDGEDGLSQAGGQAALDQEEEEEEDQDIEVKGARRDLIKEFMNILGIYSQLSGRNPSIIRRICTARKTYFRLYDPPPILGKEMDMHTTYKCTYIQ